MLYPSRCHLVKYDQAWVDVSTTYNLANDTTWPGVPPEFAMKQAVNAI